MARVALQNVRKVYDNGVVAVQDVSFEVRDGEFVVLVGPSGCGKSTTLRMIAGLTSVSSGDVFIGDRRVNDVAPKDRDVAMVFQNYALYPHMSVFDNIAFGLRLRKYPRDEIRGRVHDAARTLGIESILDRRPRQLSGGQRQRVAVGRAIVRKPRVFLFDEPLSNLDAKLRVRMRRQIADLHRRLGATMLYVTHDQSEAMTMGERIVVLDDGAVQQVDAPLALYHHPANRFVAGFIGSPGMNFIPGRLVRREETHFEAADDASVRFALGEAAAFSDAATRGRSVYLGVRPEALYFGEAPSATRTAVMPCLLTAVEPLGNESFVYVQAGAHELVGRIAPQPLPPPGTTVDVAFDLDRLHVFDAETGAAVAPDASSGTEAPCLTR